MERLGYYGNLWRRDKNFLSELHRHHTGELDTGYEGVDPEEETPCWLHWSFPLNNPWGSYRCLWSDWTCDPGFDPAIAHLVCDAQRRAAREETYLDGVCWDHGPEREYERQRRYPRIRDFFLHAAGWNRPRFSAAYLKRLAIKRLEGSG